ncbi:PREDICTED: uncharacterized protein LOC108368783 [Rhagoletis zephyria]|uniref:uncharacterized protein LOC108368783 n=1 Tax=Rhagoletis zephyria TaxID=28612 RepID=UPI00081135FA|nr:PREDICTED: uncharacterized protein LOC108368783 [Rhagoletis zephyria]XP_036329620.1 uncharacterized protein LOC118741754 [Rhagoletis pomonella]
MAPAFEPRTFVNGGMLRKFNGQYVSIILRIEEEAGTNLIAMSTDKQKIRVKLQDPTGGRVGSWIEVIGKPIGGDAIDGKEAILFAEDEPGLDEDAYNMMVEFLNNCKDIYRSG